MNGMMINLQKYLQTHTTEELTAEFAIAVKPHSVYPELFLFKYNQIDSPMDNSIVQECRGIILNKNWDIVSFPYTKFFNAEEPKAAIINWDSAKVYEKLDGSLVTLYFYDNKWQMSTSGTPDGSGEVQGFCTHYLNFADLFWQTWKELGYSLPSLDHKDFCFMFELMTPFNRVVVQHQKPRIALHGVRNIKTLKEHNPSDFASYGWEIVKQYPLKTLNDVFETCKTLDPIKNEGFVVVDENFARVKVKSPAYVALSHMKDNFSQRRMLQLILANESEEFLSYFKEYEGLHNEIKTKYMCLILDITETYERIKGLEVQKDFALEACKHNFSGALFAMRKGVTLTDYLNKISIQSLEKMVGI